jgi:hypothetical protein
VLLAGVGRAIRCSTEEAVRVILSGEVHQVEY